MAEKQSSVVQRAFTSVTETVFPGSQSLRHVLKEKNLGSGTELVSDLLLQMCLYFNSYFSLFWFFSSITMLVTKYKYLASYYKFILIVIYIIMVVVEMIRLYLGNVGNLNEKVPELAGFWLLTLLLQLPLTLLLLFNEAAIVLPLERAVHIVMAIFVILEVVQGYRVINMLTRNQISKFHLRHLEDFVELEDFPGGREETDVILAPQR
ncbi:transmembrane protein 17B-like [Xenia sp. Carnegie-2017]|uniref:transmembrane protein 17B-like n=1 Tax=Xenia sp. Carnegie-2017 TaxID=2897299 RepID=UPI001F04257F|nr:transmembrane protein 17B-like [Xenia sp. Carnegie-2017]